MELGHFARRARPPWGERSGAGGTGGADPVFKAERVYARRSHLTTLLIIVFPSSRLSEACMGNSQILQGNWSSNIHIGQVANLRGGGGGQ